MGAFNLPVGFFALVGSNPVPFGHDDGFQRLCFSEGMWAACVCVLREGEGEQRVRACQCVRVCVCVCERASERERERERYMSVQVCLCAPASRVISSHSVTSPHLPVRRRSS